MAALNKVLLIGNVGGDPEIRTLPSGSKVANFSLATSESYTDRTGQKQTQTEWHKIELWDALANIAEQYVKKGDSLYIEGKIRNEKWTDQSGVERSGIRIRGLAMQMLSGANRNEGNFTSENTSGNNYQSNAAPQKSTQEVPAPIAMNTEEDDLPF